jgi:hypothetical protein
MSSPIEYIVMGEDGHEYGPVEAGQIREWVAEGGLEKKTPVKPSNARDWIFLGDLREFAGLFSSSQMSPAASSLRKALIPAIVAALAAAAYLLYRHLHPH